MFLLIFLLSFSEAVLQELDVTLEHRGEYIAQREQLIAGATTPEERYMAYDAFNTDSALYYAERMVATAVDSVELQRAHIFRAKSLAVHGMYRQAKEILLPMTPDPVNAFFYYQALGLTFVWESVFSTIRTEQEQARAAIPEIRRRIIDLYDDPVWRVQEHALLLLDSDIVASTALLHTVLDTLPRENDYTRYLANTMGSCYRIRNMEDSALYYFAISAISDMEHGVMEHASLREVALILYRRGDIDRAYRYMSTCIEDARFCRARLRTIEMANDMPVILNTYQQAIEGRARMRAYIIIGLLVGVLVLLLFLFVVAYLLRRVARARRELLRATNELKRNHINLQQASRIQNTYLTQYIRECSDIIERLDTHQRELIHIARQGKFEPLYNAVRNTDFIDGILRDFYADFDASFLALCPRFVSDLNALLRSDAQFVLPENGRFSTQLRICALIRLGITDSDDIARFLRHSTKTIYNYRAAIRNAALDNRDDLESRIRAIPMA